VVNIARDPRDVALSLTQVPWGPSTFAGGLLYWRRFEEGGADFLAADAKSVTVRYEDLVTQPERVLRELCPQLGEPFEPSMLQTGREADALRRPHESWKENVSRPLDATRSQRWRQVLDGDQIRLAHLLVGDRLAAHGSPDAADADAAESYVCVRPRTERLAAVPELLEELCASGSRIWRRDSKERPRMGVYVGSPDRDGWLGYRRGERLHEAVSIVRELLGLRVARRRVRWIDGSSSAGAEGWCGRFVRGALALLANERVDAARLEPCQ
jgi:hypothetical protein